jgi:DNA polymerase-3 subunit gamma/tau
MPYQVIARKYRPQTFDDVVGQRTATETLKNAIRHDRVAHGYIFSGARGVGKTTTARILAKALNCAQGPTVTPDGTCDSCQEIAGGNSVDVLEIDAASNRGIDEIRELRETARYLPARDRYKIFIVDEAHMLTTEAFNALLKTLEEPPPRCLFILATTEAHKLPTTIQSRCQHFAFRLLDYAEVVARVREVCAAEKIECDEGSLGVIAEAAAGSLRDALSLLDQVIAGCGERLTEAEVQRLLGIVPGKFLAETVDAIVAADPERVLKQLQRLSSEGHEPAAFLGELTRFIRNLMIARSAGIESPLLEVPQDTRTELGRLGNALSEEDWLRFFQILLRAQNELRYSLEPRFHLELALLKLVHARRLTSLESVLAELKELAGAHAGRAPAQSSAPSAGTAPSGPVSPVLSRPERPDGRGAAPWSSPSAQRLQSQPVAQPPSRPAPSDSVNRTVPVAPLRTVPTLATPTSGAGTTPADFRGSIGPGGASVQSGVAPSSSAIGAGKAPPAAPMPSQTQTGSADERRLAEIKNLLFSRSKRMISVSLDSAVGWRFEDGEVQFVFSSQDDGRFLAETLNLKENHEALGQVCAQVFGKPVRVRVTLQEGEAKTGPPVPEARERARHDSLVRAFEQRFDCVWVNVEDLRGAKS